MNSITPQLDSAALREDFPILQRMIHGKRFVYLDNASTTHKPQHVIDAISDYYKTSNANVHRGVYTTAEEATLAFEHAHRVAARFIHARFPETIFTKGTTESINLLAYSLMHTLKKGDEIIISLMDHHSNFVPWQQIARKTGATLKFIDVTKDFRLSETLPLTPKTKIVSLPHMSNVLGTLNHVKAIGKHVHEYDAYFIVDGAQSISHLPVDVKQLDVDFYAFSSHKLFGPTGIGVLYGKEDILATLEPFNYGGDMIKEVSKEQSTWNDLPWKFEAGTPHIAGAIGLSAALTYLQNIGMDTIQKHEQRLTAYALKRLQEIKHLTLYGPSHPGERGPVFSFNVEGVHSHDVASILDQFGIAIRGGHHCAMPLMQHLHVNSTARASCSFYNTREDIDALADALEEVYKTFTP